ncbi:MAG: RNA-binding S4 domain-containing protein [Pyrinomonadaceae bacterium]
MRLDLFLKASRLILRRTLAQEFCDAGLVKVNNLTAKSSREIKPDDEIEIRRRSRILKIRALQIPKSKQVSRAEAANLYEIISEEILNSELPEDEIITG